MVAEVQSNDVIAFGPFRLHPAARLLERDGMAVPLVGRSFDILIALAKRPGKVVSKADLIKEVWPDVTVEEGSLRFHVFTLRQALRDGQNGDRFLTTVAGRGYSLVAPVAIPTPITDIAAPELPARPQGNLPMRLSRMIGREDAVDQITQLLAVNGLVSIVGPGGIGKTTVAIAVGHSVADNYREGAYFIDLALLSDPTFVASAVSTTLGLLVQSSAVAAALAAHLREREALLIFDNCEHLIDAVATLIAQIQAEAPHVKLLITSREALRTEGEQVFLLPALETPPLETEFTAETVMQYSAARLLVERIAAGGGAFAPDDADVPFISDICRKLDGMALAIELAASRVQAFGLRGVAELLDDRIRLLWRGRRTAPTRHHTLNATLDWSYNLLSEPERRVLDRLSIFVGACDLAAAEAVVETDDLDRSAVLEALEGLVSKSLVSSKPGLDGISLQLLQTTRGYVRVRAAANEDFNNLAFKHAEHFAGFLQNVISSQVARAPNYFGQHLGNIRAALEWSFSSAGNPEIALRLATASAAVFLELSLLNECEIWCRRALGALQVAKPQSRFEMELQAAHGLSLMFTKGNGEEVRSALLRGLELAALWNDDYRQLQILGALNTYQTRLCEFVGAVETARRCEAVALRMNDPAATSMANWMLGVSLQGAGDQGAAQSYCEAAVRATPVSDKMQSLNMGYDHRLRALMALARCQWLQGKVSLGIQLLADAMREAEALGDAVTMSIVMMYTVPVHIWMEEWDLAEALLERQMQHADKHGLGPYKAVGVGLSGELAVRRGQPEIGVPLLIESLQTLRAGRHKWWLTVFECALAEGLLMLGRIGEARRASAAAMELLMQDGETWYTAEVLRIAAVIASGPDANTEHAEALLHEAIAVAERQSAFAWRLRATVDLARLRIQQGRSDDASSTLEPVLDGYMEARPSPDATRAFALLKDPNWLSGRKSNNF